MRFVALALAVAAAECQHAPSEDSLPPARSAAAPPPTASFVTAGASGPVSDPLSASESSGSGPAFDGRCVLPTPEQPPPAVSPGPAAGCPADPEGASATLPVVPVRFVDPRGPQVEAEIVRTLHDTSRGLMYRTHLDEDRGMLFDLRVREDHKFWMHNTCVPLDLLFIDFDGLIVGIVESAPTLNDASRGVGCPSRWVLEVNAGWSRRHGVRAGQRVELPQAARTP